MTANSDLVIFKNLVAYYVQRQRLVVLALLDIAPELLTWPENRSSILGIHIAPYIHAYEQRINQHGSEAIQSGIWKHEWRYWQHGHGCRLTHIQTEEVLEWDAPDPNAFDVGWFFSHLSWRIELEADDPFVKAYIAHQLSYEIFRSLLVPPNFMRLQIQPNMYKWVGVANESPIP